jgi:dihydrolipoamide dehydrogenase
VAEEIAGLDPRPIDEAGIPRVTYSHPEVASVGLDEQAAIAQYGADAIETLTYDLGGNGKSQILRTQGFVKLVRRADGPVVGVHIVGARAGELIGEAQLIYNWEAHPEDVAPLVHAHPTQNEALGEAHLALAGKPLHAHS